MFEDDLDAAIFEKKGDLWYVKAADEDAGASEDDVVTECSEEGYHRVIFCMGLSFDGSIFDASTMPDRTKHAKYEVERHFHPVQSHLTPFSTPAV